MSDIFAGDSTLYNGSESPIGGGLTNYYPPRISTSDGAPDSTVVPSAAQSKFGGVSMRFDGSTTALAFVGAPWTQAINTSVGWSGSITAEAWVRLDAVTGNQALFSHRKVASSALFDPCSFALFAAGNQLVFYDAAQFFGIAGSDMIATTPYASLPFGTLTAATWHHIAWVALAGSNNHFVYLDGVKVFEYTANRPVTDILPYPIVATPWPVTAVYGGSFGAVSPYTTVSPPTAYMDDVRFSHVARYTANFTPPTSAFDTTVPPAVYGGGSAAGAVGGGAVGGYRVLATGSASGAGAASGRLGAKVLGVPLLTTDPIAGKVLSIVNDEIPPAVLAGGPSESSAQVKFGTKSIRFSGAGVIQPAARVTVGAEAASTIDFWLRADSTASTQILADRYPRSDIGSVSWTLLLTGGALVVHTNEGTGFATLPAGSISAGVWTYVRWISSGASQALYVDGVEVMRAMMPTAMSLDGGSSVEYGTLKDSSSRAWSSLIYPVAIPFIGYMDDLRETKAVRNGSNFTVPIFEATLDLGSSMQGDGAAAGAGMALAESVAQAWRLGDASATGTSTAAALGGQIRGGAGSAAGLAGAAAESDNDANPPTTAVTVSFAATIEADTVTVESIVSTWSAATTQAGSIVLDGALNAAPVFAATWATQQELSAELFALVRMLGTLPQQNDRGLAWVVNTLTGGSSMYEGFDFNSFGKLDAAYIGCKSDGIYVLDGDDDNGAPIQASVSFGKTDMGSPHLQRMIKAYADIASTAPMALKITTGADEFIYVARDFDEALTTQRFDVGRGLEARYFTFEIFNTDGCDFSLSNASFLTNDIMHRRI